MKQLNQLNQLNQKFKPLVARSLLVLTVISAPLVSFAKEDKHGDDNNDGKAKVELHGNVVAKNNVATYGNNSIFTRLFGGLFTNKANAATTNTTVASTVPSISGITAPTVLKAGVEGTWTVKASDPQNGSLSYAVDWGEASSMLKSMVAPAFVQTSTFTHTYANPGVYTVKFTVKNEAGRSTTSTASVYIVKDQTQNAPVISSFTAVSAAPRKATLEWKTDVNASSEVWYGIAAGIDTSVKANVSRSFFKVLNHKVNLTNLTPDTTYYVVVGSSNKAGAGLSSEISFKTPALPSTDAPVIKSLTGPATVAVGAEETVTINAFDPKNDSITYSADWGDNIVAGTMLRAASLPEFVQTATFSHVYSNAGVYTATFTAQNSAGLKDTETLKITVTADTTAPVITTAPTASTVGASTATLSWKTDEATTAQIFYSKVTPVDVDADTTISVTDETFATDHSINLSGLSANTTYHVIVKSSDASDNSTSSSEVTFTTQP